jgi:CRP/FNR family transcriptional regulator, cyclic AMP receptor protein
MGLGYPPQVASAVHQTDTSDALASGSFARVEPAAIQAIGVFSDFDESKRAQVAQACRECEFEAGTKLTEEGDFGYAMFAVLEGTADVSRNGEYIRTLGPGDVFGEIAIFFGGQRTATVTATSPMRLVMLFNSELARLDHEVPELADELRKVIAERLERDGR